MKQILGVTVIVLTVIFAGYLIVWWGIVEPIMETYDHIKHDTLTGSILAWSIAKFFLKELIGGVVCATGITIGINLMKH